MSTLFNGAAAPFSPTATISEFAMGSPTTTPVSYQEACRPGPDHGDWGKRDRVDANKGKRAKALKKNRKAAKVARKARKK